MECSDLNALVCGSLQDKSVGRNAHNGGVVCDIAEGILKTLKDSVGNIYMLFWIKNLWFLAILGVKTQPKEQETRTMKEKSSVLC